MILITEHQKTYQTITRVCNNLTDAFRTTQELKNKLKVTRRKDVQKETSKFISSNVSAKKQTSPGAGTGIENYESELAAFLFNDLEATEKEFIECCLKNNKIKTFQTGEQVSFMKIYRLNKFDNFLKHRLKEINLANHSNEKSDAGIKLKFKTTRAKLIAWFVLFKDAGLLDVEKDSELSKILESIFEYNEGVLVNIKKEISKFRNLDRNPEKIIAEIIDVLKNTTIKTVIDPDYNT